MGGIERLKSFHPVRAGVEAINNTYVAQTFTLHIHTSGESNNDGVEDISLAVTETKEGERKGRRMKAMMEEKNMA